MEGHVQTIYANTGVFVHFFSLPHLSGNVCVWKCDHLAWSAKVESIRLISVLFLHLYRYLPVFSHCSLVSGKHSEHVFSHARSGGEMSGQHCWVIFTHMTKDQKHAKPFSNPLPFYLACTQAYTVLVHCKPRSPI